MLQRQFARGIPGKGLHTTEHLKERHAHRVDITAAVQDIAHPLFRPHVGFGPGQVAMRRDLHATIHLCQPKVGEDGIAEIVQQHVARVNVAVNDTPLMGVMQSAPDLIQHV